MGEDGERDVAAGNVEHIIFPSRHMVIGHPAWAGPTACSILNIQIGRQQETIYHLFVYTPAVIIRRGNQSLIAPGDIDTSPACLTASYRYVANEPIIGYFCSLYESKKQSFLFSRFRPCPKSVDSCLALPS